MFDASKLVFILIENNNYIDIATCILFHNELNHIFFNIFAYVEKTIIQISYQIDKIAH